MSNPRYKVMAITSILRTVKPGEHGDKIKGVPPTKPVTQDIPPGAIFIAKDKGEYDSLKAAGAIRDYSNADEAERIRLTTVTGEDDGDGPGSDVNVMSDAEIAAAKTSAAANEALVQKTAADDAAQKAANEAAAATASRKGTKTGKSLDGETSSSDVI